MIDLSLLSRRSTNGPVTWRSSRVAASSPSRSIGPEKRLVNEVIDPSRPGFNTFINDHSSARRFSTGVPVSAIRRCADSAATALAVLVRGFLICWASSRANRPQVSVCSWSASRATSE